MTTRIAHLSDIHFGGEIAEAVEAALGAVDAFDPTFVAVTGDLTLNGLPREFRAARSWLDRFRQPLVVTPGNHDTPYWNLILRALVPFERYRRYIGPASGPDRLRRTSPGRCALSTALAARSPVPIGPRARWRWASWRR